MSTDTREALAALMVIAAECAQRKPLRGFEELTEAIHIGHRQFGRAHEKADEDVRMLAVRLRAVFDTLAAALATQPAQPSVELSVRAVEELLQLGYTVKDDLLYPPVVRLKKEQITKELLDGGTDGAPMRAFLEAEGKSTTPAQPSDELLRIRAEAEALRSVMIAAAEEIQAHWPAHCDAEGYGPANLMRRLEEGIPSQYAYTAGDFVRLRAEAEALRKDAERWRSLYRRALNEANGLTNYVEDRPELLSAERRIAKIEEEARAAIAATKEQQA